MFTFLIASLLVVGSRALLFPLNNGQEPEPELLFACPAPNPPKYGSLNCSYSMFSMTCTARCDGQFQFEDGRHSHTATCDLFEGQPIKSFNDCVRIGIVSPTLPPTTARPTSSGNCVRSLTDCFSLPAGDYPYCENCRMFATCAGSGFYVRNCPGIAVFNYLTDRCEDYSTTACRN
ncbi:uncharacterized protein LOC127867797 [Dreissena polymorpha]|uniref:Chitin-binding type-2 domain-containing protein n=1 Tax=Dreissena polymorpha TaxID=45954 RepID=A0A9D4M1F5_DREPO|nr:uncharacterized protein LOC127867797 [Dreissena polymorpha]KAH3868493.1 hypothetical protein DPMN_031643 [Dreissena polymorpha]